jgi:hypothetical protein
MSRFSVIAFACSRQVVTRPKDCYDNVSSQQDKALKTCRSGAIFREAAVGSPKGLLLSHRNIDNLYPAKAVSS